MTPETIAYTGFGLDRADKKRADQAWINLQRGHRAAVVLPVWHDNSLIDEQREPDGLPSLWAVTGTDAAALLAEGDPIFLGIDPHAPEQTPYFACDLSDLDLHAAREAVGDDGEESSFVDLRRVGPILSHHEGSLLAYARGMAYWQRRHRFCGVCGHPTKSENAGHVRRCTNPDCEAPHFPRSDPAVIMLVTRETAQGPSCLLGRQPNWPPDLYSCLAGFVEPGENLETAVYREVLEESGIETKDIRYRASQPWPFPSSLMLGFRAHAITEDIDTEDDELEEAHWFDRAEIAERYQTNPDDGRLSRSDSIARWLIEDWLAETA